MFSGVSMIILIHDFHYPLSIKYQRNSLDEQIEIPPGIAEINNDSSRV